MKILTPDETRAALHGFGLDQPSGVGFAFLDPSRNTFYDWHAHDYHQLVYAIDGPSQIETRAGRYVLPAGRAAWTPAGLEHRTLISTSRGAALYFSPEMVTDTSERIRILVAEPLMREMILHATRWPRGASEVDPLASSFFRTLALLCREWLEAELPLFLPGATHPAIARAMDFAAGDLASASQAGAAAAAGMSERSFRRAFTRETGMSWQAWLGQARILTAMGLLTEGRRVTDVAAEVGYASLSAFAHAFHKLTGEQPASFRRHHLPAARAVQ
ncbi:MULTISPECIES: helix-turn-helix transcriptional regulator [unclassified Sphingomonas]|uniref:AraC family transcriptional regulator n=1 Tax=unclassified Sphingomonas TaxID=196159 RepID=UPI0009282A59|nr:MULTISPECIES: helix-turn-helix transcriptional regulator [unclassified Sphingomonas]MBN8847980.1 helix-turn-helix transcriptional regulator [Sphingomonas sp.]OJV34218.1 MAG: AraC family transcriptional regulator [Sphingomonas sp. 67-36]